MWIHIVLSTLFVLDTCRKDFISSNITFSGRKHWHLRISLTISFDFIYFFSFSYPPFIFFILQHKIGKPLFGMKFSHFREKSKVWLYWSNNWVTPAKPPNIKAFAIYLKKEKRDNILRIQYFYYWVCCIPCWQHKRTSAIIAYASCFKAVGRL